ncbi:hypothetical protein CFE70_000217 [Pyrenophora teres f. teres 0-1]
MESDPCASDFNPTARPPVIEPTGYAGYCIHPPSYHDAHTDIQHEKDSWVNDLQQTERPFKPYPPFEFHQPYNPYQSLGHYDVSGPYHPSDSIPAPIYHVPAENYGPHKATLKFNAKAPVFTPTKFSKLSPTAPSFLLSRLAIFDPPSNDRKARLSKCKLILPNARKENIADYLSMLKNPQDGQVGRFTKETTYKFNKGLHRNDPVLAAIYSQIIALRKKDIGFFAIKLEANPVNDAPPLWPPGRNLFDAKAYHFEPKDKYGEKEMFWFTIMPHGSPPNANTIHVYENEKQKWVALGDWLRACYCFDRRLSDESRLKLRPNLGGRPGYSTQFKWWTYIGNSHRFETLPTELRTKIYEYALGGELYPLCSSSVPHLTLGLGYHHSLFQSRGNFESVLSRMHDRHIPEDRPFVYEPRVSILSLNKTIRDEALHTAWAIMRSCFVDRGLFEGAINAQPGAAKPYKYLGKIELNFTNHGYSRFFGVEMGRDHLYIGVSSSLGSRLQTLENLYDLHLRFRIPPEYPYSAWFNSMDPGVSPFGDCQRTVVDWICTFAYPFLIDKCKEGKLKVALTGAVKTDTKEKWEAIFQKKREHDQAAAMANILNKPKKELLGMQNVGSIGAME